MESTGIDDIVHRCRKSRINFCLDKGMGMVWLDMSALPWWERAFRRKEFVLWKEDMDGLREFVKAYEECGRGRGRVGF